MQNNDPGSNGTAPHETDVLSFCEYTASMLREFHRMAEERNLPMLAYLLAYLLAVTGEEAWRVARASAGPTDQDPAPI